ncbi:hybrid sensor histidine kinase/response regulator [Altibacter sp. HG106]|uniref:hybrid sensor histidine kinase/response regulator n=1 Tax=Altibacter sp. HG106 TaxID=3023937 RepID=UPI00234FDF19|nr:ATP-binding protein [Altibacter sp. HG106]MDC7995227.1 ATP-binding protein [Altibacter sp. HG106]
MNKPKRKFPFKVILSYLLLAAIAVFVSYFLYAEYTTYLNVESEDTNERKVVETGSLINLLYETDSFSRLALLTQEEEDLQRYEYKKDSLYRKITDLQQLVTDSTQRVKLDSVNALLDQKFDNIEQIRVLQLTRGESKPLDDILREFKNMDERIGRISVENFIQRPERLSRREYSVLKSYVDYLNENSGVDTTTVKSVTLDSMMAATRYIVAEAKRSNSRLQRSLQQKENELIQNDLTISNQLQQVITSLDSEMLMENAAALRQRQSTRRRTSKILWNFAVVGGLALLIFSYIVITDFFKTERYKKRLEQEKQYSEDLLKTREQLLATVSHDLKTPLNTIVGYSELFGHTELSKKQKNYNQQVASSALFISRLVDDLMDFSKLEAGKLPLDQVTFSLANLLRKIGKNYSETHAEKPIQFQVHISDAIAEEFYESDPFRIQQVVNNLVGNAFKFTQKGRIQITTSLLKEAQGYQLVEIAVTDTGIGISKEKQELIFKEFTQAESDTFKKFGGSGLGLTISQKIAKLMDGSLSVESTPGEGSSFFFTLPLKLSATKKPQKTEDLPRLQHDMTAVVIDDDPSMIAMLTEVFEQLNITCFGYTRFDDFKEADALRFDFLLTDLQMPEVSGFEVLETLKSGALETYQGEPVIIMTGSKEFTREAFLKAGFSEMLPKPFSKRQLLKALAPLFGSPFIMADDSAEKRNDAQPSHNTFELSRMRSFVDSEESLKEVLRVYCEQSTDDLQLLEHALKKGAESDVKNIAHKMLTMSRQLDAQEVVVLLEKLEDNGLSEQPKKTFETLLTAHHRLTEALKLELSL